MTSTERRMESNSTSVNVGVRIRPQSAKEKMAMNQICTSVSPNFSQISIGKETSFTYDHVFNMHTSQEQIFQTLCKPLIDGCMDGYNATIIAYGQTGSGKTYTMGTGFEMGIGHSEAGIIPRAVQYLFSCVAQRRSEAAAVHKPVPEFKVVAQFLELYNEELVDLLDADRTRNAHLRLHENAQGDIYLTGVSTRLVSSLDDTLKCLRDGTLVRSTASTNMNAQSSRSHAIFTLHIRQQRVVKYDEVGEDGEMKLPDVQSDANSDLDSAIAVDEVPEFETLTAKFHFVDLAGSERLKRTGATGDRAREGISINRGLLALGNVISALGDKSKLGQHVPYRDSKLTRMLQDSLGGNSRTIMIACISPSDCDFLETLNTLKYANRARNIRNRVVINQDKSSKQLAALRTQLALLQEELDEYRQGKRLAGETTDISRELSLLQRENDKLRLRIKALAVTVDSLTVRNARLMSEKEAIYWASSTAPSSEDAGGDAPSAGFAKDSQFQQVIEKYTLEAEELRKKLAEAEALVEFNQRPFSYATTTGRLSDGFNCALGSAKTVAAANRVALTNNEFPDLDSSMMAAAEAGLSATSFYLDEDEELDGEDVTIASTKKTKRRKARRRRNRRAHSSDSKSRSVTTASPVNGLKLANLNGAVVDDEEADDGKTCSYDDPNDAFVLSDADKKMTSTPRTEDDHIDDDVNGTLQPDFESDNKPVRPRSMSCGRVGATSNSESVSSGSTDFDDSDIDATCTGKSSLGEAEAKLHRNLAYVTSEIDSKERLLAALQSKAAQLNRLRKHYERQLTNLQSRIRETERERDTVLANLGQIEHTGEARLRKTRDEYEKQITSMQEEVRALQKTRQEHVRMERTQAKKNEELRQLRSELEQLRRYKVDITRRLREETKRTREIEAESMKRMTELKKAKSQADSHIRSLEAAHSAKERALQQKQAEVDALKRKTFEQQRQLSQPFSANRMVRSFVASTTTPNHVSIAGRVGRRPPTHNQMTNSLYARTPRSHTGFATGNVTHSRLMNAAKAKWGVVARELEAAVQRRQTAARLEHDLQIWVAERENLGRRLQRLQRRRTRIEEEAVAVATDDQDADEHPPQLAQFDEQIRNVTSQLESVQEAIRECQSSIIELDKSGPKPSSVCAPRTARLGAGQSATPQFTFANCTLSESRYLLEQLFETVIARSLQTFKAQHSESQLKAQLTVREQECEQVMDMLRLAMQHGGVPLDSIDTMFPATESSAANSVKYASLPSRVHSTTNACDCWSASGVPSSVPPSPDVSSDSDDNVGGGTTRSTLVDTGGCNHLFNPGVDRSNLSSLSSRTGACSFMSHSMYAALRTNASELCSAGESSAVRPVSDRLYDGIGDINSSTVKARRRVLHADDMLGLSASCQSQPNSGDLMPPPSGASLPRRPRAAPQPMTNTVTTSVNLPYAPRLTGPLSGSPSPATKRRTPAFAIVPTTANSTTTAVNVSRPISISSVPVSMSASLTLPNTNDSTTNETIINELDLTITNQNDQADVFNRLTSGMSNSPHPCRGSIKPMQRNAPHSPSSMSAFSTLQFSAVSGSTISSVHNATQPYRLATSSSTAVAGAPTLTVTGNGLAGAATSQPLAAFFTNSVVAPSVSCNEPTLNESSETSAALTLGTPGLQQPVSGFRAPMECTHIARGHSNAVLDVDLKGTLMVTGSKDRTAKLWDLNTMEEIDTLADHPNNVSKVRFCPYSDLIFTICSYFVKIWDRRDARKCVRTLLSSGLNQDGSLETKVTRRQNICPPGETNIMDLALGGQNPALSHTMFLATANSVKLWDLRRYFSVGKLHGAHQAPVMVLAAGETPSCQFANTNVNDNNCNAEPQLTVVTGSKDHYIKVFNVAGNSTGLFTPTFDLEPPHYDGIESLSLYGSILFSGSRDAAIKKWNLARGGRQEVLMAQAHKDWIQGLAVTDDGLNLISGCRGGTLKLWNVEDCTCIGEVLNAHEGSINAVRTLEDRVFTAGSDKDIRFWRLFDQHYR